MTLAESISMNINLENIPDELKEYEQWVCWKADQRVNGKMDKIPINPSNGNRAKTNDPETWAKFTDAVASYRSYGLDGIGFVFTKKDPFVGIDLDDCIEPASGKIDPSAQQIIAQMESYTEISPSGRGVHILVKGKIPGAGRNKDKIEIYDEKRFFTITGNLLNNCNRTVNQRIPGLQQLYCQFSGQPEIAPVDPLIEKALNAENGDKFRMLWHGNYHNYPSHSDADLALCKMLAFWTDNNPKEIDRHFRESGLFRDKWNEIHYANGNTYGEATIRKAINTTSETYCPIQEQLEPASISDDFNLTDLGNAERFVHHFGKDIRYCHAWQKWLIWDGIRWSVDKTDQIRQLAKKVIRKIYSEAENTVDSGKRKAIATHAMKSEAGNRIRTMIELAKSDVSITPEELDQDSWLLTCINGTIDLRTGELLAHQRDHFITQLAPVEFDKNALCSRWRSFLERIMDGNENLISFLQRAVGYSLTGENTEQCLFILYGSGANGKSTFLQTLNAMLGDYAKQTPTETLLVKQKGAIPNDVARLKGARFVTASEAESDQKLAESLIKQMTGGDTISARFLHQEWFDFQPTHKVFLGTNHKPVIKGTDHAIWRRIRLIPFEITIPESERDQSLQNKLRDELSGILTWALKGCLDWQKNGLGIPNEVKEATDTYRGEMDALAEFLNDCCQDDPASKVTSKELYAAYTAWCESNGEDCLKQRSFALRLKEKGFKQVRIGTDGTRGWKEMRLLT